MQFDKNIPMPTTNPKTGRAIMYDWSNMEIGDSIFISPYKDANYAIFNLKRFIKANGLNWSVLSVKINGGKRIWRNK